MNPTHYTQLIPGKKYYIHQPVTKYLSSQLYKGTFVKNHSFNNLPYLLSLFEDISALKPLEYLGTFNFGITDVYYDLDKIKENARKAQESMEKRALGMILKRVLNEDFVW